MTKRFFYAAMAAGLLIGATACSSQEEPVDGSDDAQVIEICVASDNSINTRAGRDLDSDQAMQEIENVAVFIYDADGNLMYKHLFSQWTDASTPDSEVYGTNDQYNNAQAHGRVAKIVLQGSEKLPWGTSNKDYSVYAFGFSNGSDYNAGSDATKKLYQILGYDEGTKSLGNPTVVELTNAKLAYDIDTNDMGEEMFAGFSSITVSTKGDCKGTVILHRQVAGVMLYVNEIPYDATMDRIQLVCHNANKELVLGDYDWFGTNEVLNNGNGTQKYKINGTNPVDAETVILEMKFADWFNNIQADANGLLDASAANWKSSASHKYKTGSMFAASFMIPVITDGSTQTFVLRIVDASDNVLRYWNINTPSYPASGLTALYYSWYDDAAGNFTLPSVTENANCYSICRNHLYTIGTRHSTNEPTDPDPTDDDPQSLNASQDLTLKVNDNWIGIHDMILQ